MALKMNLRSLLDLAIGKPEAGTVNFTALHSFLQKLLGHLAVADAEVEVSLDKTDGDGEPTFSGSTYESKTKLESEIFPTGGVVEKRIHYLEDKMNLLESFTETDEILNWAKGRESSNTKVADLWTFMNFQKRIEASENGIRKVGTLVDKILAQLQNVTDLQDRMFILENKMDEVDNIKEEVKNLSEKVEILSGDKKFDEIIGDLNKMKTTMDNMPVKKDLLAYVKWPDLQSALETGKVDISQEVSTEQSKPSNLEADKAMHGDDGSGLQGSLHPSQLVLHKLGEIGGLPKGHSILKEDVENIKQELKNKADKKALEELASRDLPEDLIQQLAGLSSTLDDLKMWQMNVAGDISSIARMNKDIDEMKADIEKLQTKMKLVVEEHTRKQVHIDTLYTKTDKLEETKADKEYLDIQLSNKIDKTDLENFVSRQRFDSNITRIDDALKELIDQVASNDDGFNKMISRLFSDLNGKLDRDEYIEFKEKVESRLKALKSKIRDELNLDEDPAAVFKKAMLQFNCLSCDRPVHFSGNNPIQGYPGYSTAKSGRPYTTYDLEQLRLLQKSSLKPESPDYSMSRSCGGSHTSGVPSRRITAKLMNEVDIQGQDGKLYKGRIDKSEVNKSEEFPTFKNGRMKPKSAHSVRSSGLLSPGEGNMIPRRPKTAFSRSPTMEQAERQHFHGRVPSQEFNSDQDEEDGDEDIQI